MIELLIYDLVKYLLTIIFVVFTIFFSLRIFDLFTNSLDEWKEIKKGNLAISLFCCSVLLSVFLIIFPLIQLLISAILALAVIPSLLLLVSYLLVLFFVIFTIYLLLNLVDKLTLDLNELAELKKDNIAVSVFLSLIILVSGFALSWAIEPLFLLIKKTLI